ncbi:putative protein kinase [Legionella geestiana]|uniref:Protein kinase domain-containing protein n=1 Tax=Legionella geestiana TaxID=45065 RepID=A0A0W0TXK5_9GAMM|nr:protein kinase [Legionella geestiana]KTD00140.1 putative protein kinase [Legionella geestiana]STX53491.1 Serine/threonine protein kinase [Legionella geestiana]
MSIKHLDAASAKKLFKQLKKEVDAGTFYWLQGHVFTFDDGTQYTLTHDVSARRRRDGRTGLRFEWLKNTPYCTPGTTGKIYLSKATLTDTRVKPAGTNGRVRLVKIQQHTDKFSWEFAVSEHRYASRSGHLHTRYPTMLVDEEDLTHYRLVLKRPKIDYQGSGQIFIQNDSDGRLYCTFITDSGKYVQKYRLPENLVFKKPLDERALKLLHEPVLLSLAESGFIPSKSLIFMHRMPGKTLFDILTDEQKGSMLPLVIRLLLTIEIVRTIRLQTVECGIIHRDIKPENILVDFSDGIHVNLVDYAYGRDIDTFDRLCPGTPCYAAPEILDGQSTQTPAVDVFSTGRTLLMLWRCSNLFFRPSQLENGFDNTDLKVLDTLFSGLIDIPRVLADKLKSLFTDMLQRNPEARPSLRLVETQLEAMLALLVQLREPPSMPASSIQKEAPPSDSFSHSDIKAMVSDFDIEADPGFEPPFGPVQLDKKHRLLINNILECTDLLRQSARAGRGYSAEITRISDCAARLLNGSFSDYLEAAPESINTMENALAALSRKPSKKHWHFFCAPLFFGTGAGVDIDYAEHLSALQDAINGLKNHDIDCWRDFLPLQESAIPGPRKAS